MTTKDIIEEAKRQSPMKARRTDDGQEYYSYYEFPILAFNEFVRTLLESFGEEICPEWIDNPYGEVTNYSVGRRDERKAIRLKVKEIISSLEK